jgi:DNA polymerase-1
VAESPRKRLILIDGYSLLYRAFFATRYLSTSDGRPTNALFGFTSMLLNLIEKIQPDAVVVALELRSSARCLSRERMST